MELFSPFPGLDKKKSCTKSFSYLPRSKKLIFKTGNRMIQTGYEIISPIYKPLVKKLLLQSVSYSNQGVQINFQNRKSNIKTGKFNNH